MCGLDTMCGMNVGCKRICCGAGVMWCSAGEDKRERVEGERGKKGKDYIKKNGKRVGIYMNFLIIGIIFEI